MDEPLTLQSVIIILGGLVTAGTLLWRLQALFRRQEQSQAAALERMADAHATSLDQHRKASEDGRRRLYERMEAMDTGWERRFEKFRVHCDETYVHARVHAAEMGAVREAMHELNVNMTQINGRVCPIHQEVQPPPKRG